jgi:phospholipid/cholesterol/gamma-HCH transport system ATP-binding protein
MIRLIDIYKSFGDQHVLEGLNLDIPRGAITVIIGSSGTGKSVLLKILMGLLMPDKGQVLIEGKDLVKLSNEKQSEMRKRFGFLFQGAALFDSMNVEDNVAFPLWEHTKMNETEIHQKVVEILAQVGLKNIGHKMPSELSGGMKKRVGLARALVLEPEVVLYDEPTTGLDPILSDSIDKLILDTQKRLNITSVVVSHDIQATIKIADKIAMLHEGRILEEGSPEHFRASQNTFVQRFLTGKAEKGFIG